MESTATCVIKRRVADADGGVPVSTKTGECQKIQMGEGQQGHIKLEGIYNMGKPHFLMKNSAVSSFLIKYCSHNNTHKIKAN